MKKLLVLALAAVMLLCFAACGNSGESANNETAPATTAASAPETEPATESVTEFKVSVVDIDGNAIPGTMVQICKDTCVPAVSDANGIATFYIAIEEGHKLSVTACPEGYVYTGDAEIYLEEGETEYKIVLQKTDAQ